MGHPVPGPVPPQARAGRRPALGLIRLALRVRREDAEVVLAELIELFPAGVEETDAGDAVEYAVYGAPGELPSLPDLEAAVGGALVEVTTSEVADDWADRWRAFHRPLTVGGVVHVRPPWSAAPVASLVDVVIDPGRAFGTGAHATTSLCLELLVSLGRLNGGDEGDEPGSSLCDARQVEPVAGSLGPLADYGAGSGVLSIAAAKLGYSPVVAVDNDPLAVSATLENAAVNGVSLEVGRVDLRSDPLPAAPTVVANLLRPLLLVVASRLPEPLPHTLIASGLLPSEVDEVAAAFAARGLRERERRTVGDWGAVLLAD